MTREQLKPTLPDMAVFQKREEKMKHKMNYFDSRQRAQTLPELNTGDTVWLPNGTDRSFSFRENRT